MDKQLHPYNLFVGITALILQRNIELHRRNHSEYGLSQWQTALHCNVHHSLTDLISQMTFFVMGSGLHRIIGQMDEMSKWIIMFIRRDSHVVGRHGSDVTCASKLALLPQIAMFMRPTWGPLGPRWSQCWPHEPCYWSAASQKASLMWLAASCTKHGIQGCTFHAGRLLSNQTPSYGHKNPHYKSKTVWRPCRV